MEAVRSKKSGRTLRFSLRRRRTSSLKAKGSNMLLLFLFFHLFFYFYFFAQEGGILRILQSDWLWGRNPSPGCVSLCNDLKFPFFHTESVYIQK